MLFTAFFLPNVIVFDFWMFKVSLYLSKQFSVFLSSTLTNFSDEVESSLEAKSAVPSEKRRAFKFEAFVKPFTCRRNKIRPRTLPCGTLFLNFYLNWLNLYM